MKSFVKTRKFFTRTVEISGMSRLSRHSSPHRVRELVKDCLDDFYDMDGPVLERNSGRGVCERAIVFRLAHYLQKRIGNYFVDCDFNSSFEKSFGPAGTIILRARDGKPIGNVDRSSTKRFIDVIVHRRDANYQNNLICFEVKKWNNKNSKEIEKDENNLSVLTTPSFGYLYGFHLILHKKKSDSTWTIFQGGAVVERGSKIY